MKLTISEAITTQKTLKARHAELVQLRNSNSENETRFYGNDAQRQVEKKVLYDVKKLDKLVTSVAKEIRLLDVALKSANAKTIVKGYEWDDSKLGEVE
jgi:hypothetical protein